jgi:hypothetical protein
MCATITPNVEPLTTDETLTAVLSPTHDVWIGDARRLLLPAAVPEATFLARWSAVRYLDDQFTERVTAERALMTELLPFVSPREATLLEAGAERVTWLHFALARIGCRRGTAPEFAHTAAELLRALDLWCAQIELAAARVRPAALTPEGQRVLGQLTAPIMMFWRASA